jgi:6-phosphogluconolactonase
VGTAEGPIHVLYAIAATGELKVLEEVDAGASPSFLAFDPTVTRVFSVDEGSAQVSSFEVERGRGRLLRLSTASSGGESPAHLSVDRSGRFLLVANYNGGNVRVLPIDAAGKLGEPTETRATGKWAHMIVTDPTNRYAFVPNKGDDRISQFVFDSRKGTLIPNTVFAVSTARGAGPRHLAFHPLGRVAYVINELDDTLGTYELDGGTGRLTPKRVLSTLPPGTDGANNTCAEVVVAPSGRFVYGSNRGHDSIAIFAVDPIDLHLTFLGTTPSGGKVPRSFDLSENGEVMLVANESGEIARFAVDVASGALTLVDTLPLRGRPQFVDMVTVPGTRL